MRIYVSQFYVIIKRKTTVYVATPTVLNSTKLVYSMYRIRNEK